MRRKLKSIEKLTADILLLNNEWYLVSVLKTSYFRKKKCVLNKDTIGGLSHFPE
jgi:hypothetical protein